MPTVLTTLMTVVCAIADNDAAETMSVGDKGETFGKVHVPGGSLFAFLKFSRARKMTGAGRRRATNDKLNLAKRKCGESARERLR